MPSRLIDDLGADDDSDTESIKATRQRKGKALYWLQQSQQFSNI